MPYKYNPFLGGFQQVEQIWADNGSMIYPANSGRSLAMLVGAAINEFSTDSTLSGNSDTAVPVESSVKTFALNQFKKVTTVNVATYDLLATDYILNCTYTATAAITSLTLPTAQCIAGRVICIKDAGGGAGTKNITIDTEGSEKIDGADTKTINTNYDKVWLYSDGSNWFTL